MATRSERLSLDFETASQADLKRTGAYAYAEHRSTRVLCMAWAFDAELVDVWRPGQPFPQRVIDHVAAGGEVHGWNVLFEYVIWNLVLSREVAGLPALALEQLHDTMARAAVWGLPMSLDRAGPAAGASFTKDKQGHDLMMRMSKPRRVDPVSGEPVWWHLTDAPKYDRLCTYCARDVDTEREIAGLLPTMPAYERRVWLMDARLNLRGFRIDAAAVGRLGTVARDEMKALDARMWKITGGAVASTTNVGNLATYANSFGFQNTGMDATTLDELLADPRVWMHPNLLEALELRRSARKTSTKKLKAMTDAVSADGRVRGMFQYAGAGRTLRWAGRLVQPQNLPRPAKGIDPDQVISHVLAGADQEVIRLVWGDPLDIIASCLRGCFVARDGCTFAVCDFSAIEARVVAWLAGQQNILDVFASGADVYVYTAAQIGSTDRQLGKVLVLACGFGMGPGKFLETAATYGIHLDPMEAEDLVRAWRTANYKIQRFWYDLDAAARDAIENPGFEYTVGKVKLRMGRNRMTGALLMEMPSGHFISYRDAQLVWENGRQSISYMGVDQQTRQWVRQRTYGGKLAENATQSVARHLLADAMLRMEDAGLPLVATIHDEVVAEVPEPDGQAAYALMKQIMSTPPGWGAGLPLGGAGWVGRRYGKG